MGAVNLRRIQNELLASGFLDEQATTLSNQSDFGPVELNFLEKALVGAAAEFVTATKDNLISSDRVSSGDLTDSIVPTALQSNSGTLSIGVQVLDYYQYVDEGVVGWADREGSNSRFRFKKYTGRSGKRTSKMVEALKGWLQKEGSSITNTRVAITPREGRRMKITDASTREAIKVARIIRRKGLKKTGFWSRAVDQLNQQLPDLVAEGFKIDIINGI